MNLESILRKMIQSNMWHYQDESAKSFWMLAYSGKKLKKEMNFDETQTQAIDWFYYSVLQLEHEEEA